MPNKFYLREDRKAVKPDKEEPQLWHVYKEGRIGVLLPDQMASCVIFEAHLLSLPALDVDPDYLKRLSTGWFEGEERYEVMDTEGWIKATKEMYDSDVDDYRRLTIVAPQEATNFYCVEFERNGYTCEQQCSKCKKAEDMPQEAEKGQEGDDESKCQTCGGYNPVWSADNKLFNEVNGSPNGIICPTCFVKKANEKGINLFGLTPQPVTGEAGGKSKSKRITLCGSTKFKAEFEAINRQLTLEGNVVYSVCAFGHKDNIKWTDQQKEMLDEVHKRKIDNSDGIFVINVDDYIGESTRSEIEYAEHTGKFVKYLSDFPDLKYISDSAMIAAASRPSDAVASQEHREEVERLKARVKELEEALRNTVKVYSLMDKKTCESMGLDDPETFKAFLHAKSILRTPPTK